MADVLFRTVRDTLRTTVGTQDVTASLGGDTPVAAIVYYSLATGDTSSDALLGFGFTDGTRQKTFYGASEDGQATTDCWNASRSDKLISFSTDGGSNPDVVVTFDSFITNGIRLSVDTTNGTAYRIAVKLISGADVTSAYVNSKQMGSGATTVSDLSFETDLLFVGGVGETTENISTTPASHNKLMYGLAHNGAGTTQKGVAFSSLDGQSSETKSQCYIANNACLAQLFASSVGWTATIGSWNSTGFTITPSNTNANNRYVFYLALKFANNPDIKLVDSDGPTSATTHTVSGGGITADFCEIITADATAYNTQDTSDADGVSINLIDGTNQISIGMSDDDAATTSSAQSHLRDDFYDYSDGTSALHAATFTEFNANGCELSFSTAPTTARKWVALFIGEEIIPDGVVVNGSSDEFVVGVPPNNGAFFDGTRYWIFYTESNVLKCKYGTSLTSMASTNTNGAGNISDVDDSGKAYSIVFGQISSTWYAWAVVDTVLGSSSGAHINWYRWELTASGLGSPANVTTSIGDKSAGACIAHDYGGTTVSELYGGMQAWDTDRAHRKIDADMTNETGIGGVAFYDAANVGYLETGKFIKLSDGYLSFGFTTDGGGYAYGMEITDATPSFSGTFTDVTGTGAGSFADAKYAANTSHMGQADDCQLDDGTYYVAYIDDADATNGNYGHIILRKRGNTMASTWSTVSTDVIGSSAEAWHLAVSTDGTDIWIFYCKDSSGSRDTAIYYKKYDVSENTFGTETKLADIQINYTFHRMFTQWRAANGEIVVAWSEKNGSNYDLLAASINTAGSTNYDESISLGLSQDISNSGAAQALATAILANQVGCDDSGGAQSVGSASLNTQLGVSKSALAQALATAQQSVQLGMSTTGIIAFFVEASFTSSLGVTASAAAQGSGSVSLSTDLAQTINAIAQTIASATLSSSHGISVGSGQTVADSVMFAVSQGVTNLGLVTLGGQITLSASLAKQVSGAAQALGCLSLGASIGVQIVAQAAALAGISLGQVVSIVNTGTSIIAGITTPDGRTFTVEIETRTLTIESENRTYTVQ